MPRKDIDRKSKRVLLCLRNKSIVSPANDNHLSNIPITYEDGSKTEN